MNRFFCLLGWHRWAVADWDAEDGTLRCSDCKQTAPMTGEVLAEWIRYRTRRRRGEALMSREHRPATRRKHETSS